MSRDPVVVVGTSLAGIKTAVELRALGFDGAITLIGEEPGLPYDRPPLSKAYLLGEADDDALALTSAEEVERLDVELVSGSAVTAVDLERRRVHCDGLGEVGYTHLVAATGSHARRLAWSRRLEGIHHLRTIEDARRLRRATAEASHVTIVGGGFIGTEVASTLTARGTAVTLVVDTPHALDILGTAVGGRLTRHLRDHGVEVLTRSAVVDAVGTTRVEALRLSDGGVLQTDTVVVAVGSVPTTAWLGHAVLGGRRHLEVDDSSRAHDDVWGAGDVTGGGHWYAAVRQARLAARSICGVHDRTTQRLHDEVPYAWTDQLGHKVQTLGAVGGAQDWHLAPGVDLEELGPAGATGLYARNGLVTGAVVVDRPQDLARARRHVAAASPVQTALDDLAVMARS